MFDAHAPTERLGYLRTDGPAALPKVLTAADEDEGNVGVVDRRSPGQLAPMSRDVRYLRHS